MNDKLSPDTEHHIKQLVQEIAGSHQLDDELRRELQGHIEDKLLGYMRGDETVTEADAFVLAREHFGDEQHLRELLGAAMPHPNLTRRVLAFVLVLSLLWIAMGFVQDTLYGMLPGSGLAIASMLSFLSLYVCWRILRRWRAAEVCEAPQWFERWPAWHLGAACLGIVLLDLAVYLFRAWVFFSLPSLPLEPFHLLQAVEMLFHNLAGWIYLALSGVVCVWWCRLERAPWRRVFRMVLVFSLLLWALGQGTSLLTLSTGSDIVQVLLSANPGQFQVIPMASYFTFELDGIRFGILPRLDGFLLLAFFAGWLEIVLLPTLGAGLFWKLQQRRAGRASALAAP